MAAKSIKGITRIDYEGVATRGWMVRLTRNGERQQKFFNDKLHGGKSKSLQAAKACYETWLSQAPPIATTKDLKTSRNSTGKVGVHLVRNVDARWKNAESFGYCASWIDDTGARRKLSFAWNRYGKKHAWNLACLAREKEWSDRNKVLESYERSVSSKGKSRR
jgi:hypothetical protein